jgi:hypothetical protein
MERAFTWRVSPVASACCAGRGKPTGVTRPEQVDAHQPPADSPIPGTLYGSAAMRALVTRAYFQGETLNETDPLLVSIEEAARRATLIVKPSGAGGGGGSPVSHCCDS